MRKTKKSQAFWESQNSEIIDKKNLPERIKAYLRTEEDKIRQYCIEMHPETVLEAGCGKGRIIELINQYCKRIIGIDYSSNLVSFCSEKFKDKLSIKILEGDISHTIFDDNTFDLNILAFNTLGNIGIEKKATLLEQKRIIKPNGRLLISVYSENARDAQYEEYTDFGLTIERESENAFYLEKGVRSQRFSKSDIRTLLHESGLKGKIEPITEIGYFIIAEKR